MYYYMSRALLGPYTSTRGLNHTPDGLPVCAARIAEGKKEDSDAALDKTSHEFLYLAFDVFCGTAPRADEFFRRLASIVVTQRTGYSEGPNFSSNYANFLHKWRTLCKPNSTVPYISAQTCPYPFPLAK